MNSKATLFTVPLLFLKESSGGSCCRIPLDVDVMAEEFMASLMPGELTETMCTF